MSSNNKDSLTPILKEAIQGAFQMAWEMGKEHVDSAHVLWSLSKTNGTAGRILRHSGVDSDMIREIIEKNMKGTMPQNPNASMQYMLISPDALRIWKLAEAQMEKMEHEQLTCEHLLLSILQESRCLAHRLLTSTGADPTAMVEELLEELNKTWPGELVETAADYEPDTEMLDQYSVDLTQQAWENRLDPVVGRDKEIQRVIQILARRTKNNPVLVGEPGVGKTAIAEGLAQAIVEGDVPEELTDVRLLSLDLTKMLAGAKFRGDFEERIKGCIDEAIQCRDVILFIDEMHNLVGAGASEGAIDAANILKPSLSRGELQVIGATTMAEYRKHIEKDSALERRFQQVLIEEPSQEDAAAILQGLKSRYEEHHHLAITDDAIEAAVKLSSRYIQDRFLPDKAIDLIDEAGSQVRIKRQPSWQDRKEYYKLVDALEKEKQEAVQYQDFERAAMLRDRQKVLREQMEERLSAQAKDKSAQVTAEDVATIVSNWTGVPVTMLTEDESQRLLKLENTLHKRLIGQNEAVTAVAKAIRRSRAGIKDPRRPMGSFLFLGPTGVGKTELCKALAETMFQDEDALIRIDMSEYMEQHTVSKMIGSPPGYVGYDEGGQLTEMVRRKPYSIILFDEIEKAHRDVWNILLQIMEDGRLTDAQGRKVDFKNTVIVMTSNVGAKSLTDKRQTMGFAPAAGNAETRTQEQLKEKVMKDLKETFKPEFLNRIDDTIVFHQLDRNHIRDIAANMITTLQKRMEENGSTLQLEETAMELLVEKGFDPIYGARPLRRVIQSEIEDAAAELVLERGNERRSCITVSAADGKFILNQEFLANPENTEDSAAETSDGNAGGSNTADGADGALLDGAAPDSKPSLLKEVQEPAVYKA